MGIEYEITHVSDFTTKRQPYTQTQILLDKIFSTRQRQRHLQDAATFI